jgi:hypothetical protein
MLYKSSAIYSDVNLNKVLKYCNAPVIEYCLEENQAFKLWGTHVWLSEVMMAITGACRPS